MSECPGASLTVRILGGEEMGEAGARFSDDVGTAADEVVARLAPLGDVSWRKMFGGAAIFADGSMFALVDSDARLHLKANDSNRSRFERAGSVKHGRMPYYSVPSAVLNDDAALLEWARPSVAANAK